MASGLEHGLYSDAHGVRRRFEIVRSRTDYLDQFDENEIGRNTRSSPCESVQSSKRYALLLYGLAIC